MFVKNMSDAHPDHKKYAPTLQKLLGWLQKPQANYRILPNSQQHFHTIHNIVSHIHSIPKFRSPLSIKSQLGLPEIMRKSRNQTFGLHFCACRVTKMDIPRWNVLITRSQISFHIFNSKTEGHPPIWVYILLRCKFPCVKYSSYLPIGKTNNFELTSPSQINVMSGWDLRKRVIASSAVDLELEETPIS